eukprot:gene9008-gene9810
MSTREEVAPPLDPRDSISFTTSMPLDTFPKTTWRSSNQPVVTVVRKNCEPFVLGPALAMDNTPGPVPLWLVKSPPWHMKLGITRWKMEPLYPKPFSPVHSA